MAWPDGVAGLPVPGTIAPDDPRNVAWRALLPRAAELIAATDGAILPRLTLGGGSMLAARYGHRESRDLDFFLPDAQLLTFLAPRLNDRVARLATAYEESSNVIRFRFGPQEVDFIVGAAVLARAPSASIELAPGLRMPVEPIGEIIAKKVLYRGASFTHRDVVDLALVHVLEPAELADLPSRVGHQALATLRTRLTALTERFPEAAASRVTLRAGFEGLLPDAIPLAQDAVRTMQTAPPDSLSPRGRGLG